MEHKNFSQSSKDSSHLNINEEDLNEKSKETQKLQNQKANNELSSSQHKRSLHLSSSTNDAARKRDFTRVSLLNLENLISNSRVYQDYIKTYDRIASLFLSFKWVNNDDDYQLVIYDNKSKREKIIVIDKNKANIDNNTCIIPLPNGELFCLGSIKKESNGNTFIIDRDFNIHELPSQRYRYNSSAIYYNRNIYIFGGEDSRFMSAWIFCSRFDLDENRWINLSHIPKPIEKGNAVIFNGNILIASHWNIDILHYSIDINSFSMIPYRFYPKRKIMVNAGERLYLIESDDDWFVYESNFLDEFSWKLIASLDRIGTRHGLAYSCAYNKEKERIYILSLEDEGLDHEKRHYYKFNLNEKVLKKRRKCRIF